MLWITLVIEPHMENITWCIAADKHFHILILYHPKRQILFHYEESHVMHSAMVIIIAMIFILPFNSFQCTCIDLLYTAMLCHCCFSLLGFGSNFQEFVIFLSHEIHFAQLCGTFMSSVQQTVHRWEKKCMHVGGSCK